MNKVCPDHLQAYKDFAFDRIQNKVVFLMPMKKARKVGNLSFIRQQKSNTIAKPW
ncbi:MAG: hypothetical protein AAF228_13590 [Pseudomonadota bacterium]